MQQNTAFDYQHYLSLLEPFRIPAPPMPPSGARLRAWRWLPVRTYNGFSNDTRIWVWQVQCWAYDHGTLLRPTRCVLCGSDSRVVYHSENYADPWTSIALCQGCHMCVHRRFQSPQSWAAFQAKYHKPGQVQWFEVLPATEIDLAGWLDREGRRASGEMVLTSRATSS